MEKTFHLKTKNIRQIFENQLHAAYKKCALNPGTQVGKQKQKQGDQHTHVREGGAGVLTASNADLQDRDVYRR